MSIHNYERGILARYNLGPHFEVPLTKHGEWNMHFFVETIFLSSNFVLLAVHLNVSLLRHNGTTISSSSVKAPC